MVPDADFHSQSDTTHPYLLTLPDELKLQILSNFYNDHSDPRNALTLMILRRTHKSFRQLVPNPWKEARPTAEHYITAERRYPYLFPNACACTRPSGHSDDHCYRCYLSFPCYECLRVIKRGVWDGPPYDVPYNENFRTFEVAYWKLEGDYYERTYWDTLGGEHAQDRVCDECWKRRLEAFG